MTRYRTSIDRAGWALALGAGCVGLGLVLVAAAGGVTAPLGLLGYGVLGALIGLVAIAGIGAPVWWFTQRRRRRGPVAAGVIGASVAGVGTLLVLTRGLGAGLPVADAATLAALWTSAAATALVAGFLGGLVGLAMWLVSYRPE